MIDPNYQHTRWAIKDRLARTNGQWSTFWRVMGWLGWVILLSALAMLTDQLFAFGLVVFHAG